MADSFVQLNNDGPGKKIDTRTENTNGDHRQVMVIGDPATNANVANVTAAGAVQVDGSGVTQPVSLSGNVTVVQPTAANLNATVTGTVITTPPSNASTNLAQVGGVAISEGQKAMASSVPIVIASDQSAVPISGTVTANIGTSGSLALDASVTGLEVSQGSATSNQKGILELGAVTTSAPSYTTAQTSPLSLTTAGALRTDASATTQPVSGTVTTTPPANASTNVAQFGGTNVSTGTGAGGAGIPRVTISNDSSLAANQSVNHNQVAGAAVSTAAAGIQKVGITGNTGAAMDAAGQNAASPANELLVAGQFNTSPTTITSGNISPLQLNSKAELLIENVDLELAQGSTTSGQLGTLIQGAVTTALPAYTNAQTNPLSLSTSGQLRAAIGTNVTFAGTQNATTQIQPQDSNGIIAPLWTAPSYHGGAFSGSASAAKQGFSNGKMATIFKTASIAATATGNTAVWTPASGNKFRLLGFQITAQGLAATASASVTVSFQDASTGITFGTYDVDVPVVTSVLTGVTQVSGGFVNMGYFGILSAAANNVLNFNIATAGAGTIGTYRVNVCGTEE